MTKSDVRKEESMIENLAYELRREALAHAVDRSKHRLSSEPPVTAEQIVAEAKTFHEFLKSQ
jgi:hypothetical protein